MDKYLWKFSLYCGRSGDLDGLFVATEKEVEESIGKYAYFGEVLGKHSDVYCNLREDNIKKLDLDSEAVAKVSDLLGSTWGGFNPLHYIKYECEICEDTFHADEMHIFSEEENVCSYCQSGRDSN